MLYNIVLGGWQHMREGTVRGGSRAGTPPPTLRYRTGRCFCGEDYRTRLAKKGTLEPKKYERFLTIYWTGSGGCCYYYL